MHAKNVHHEQSQQTPELNRQQQLEQLSVRLLECLDRTLFSLRTLHEDLDTEGLHRRPPEILNRRLRGAVADLEHGREELLRLGHSLKGFLFNEAIRLVEEPTSRDGPRTRFRWLQRLDSALFSPPHTFASVLTLVVAQLEIATAADAGPASS